MIPPSTAIALCPFNVRRVRSLGIGTLREPWEEPSAHSQKVASLTCGVLSETDTTTVRPILSGGFIYN